MPGSSNMRAPYRIALAALLAMLVALVIVFGVIAILSHNTWNPQPPTSQPGPATATDEQKLQILSSLEATSSATTTKKEQALSTLDSSSSSSFTTTDKLDVLSKLQNNQAN